MSEFAAIGNVSIDDLVFADGRTLWAMPGGNSLYAALGMRLWVDQPALVARVGPDYPRQDLDLDGIDMSFCTPISRSLRNWGLYEEDGSRHFIFRTATRNWIDFCPEVGEVEPVRALYCHLAPLPWRRHLELAEHLRQNGARLISVDPDERHISEAGSRDFARLLELVDFFLPSRQDVESMYPESDLLDALRELRVLGRRTPAIIFKLGAEGVLVHSADSPTYAIVPAIARHAVDPTGAGDAFCGGFLCGFAQTNDPVAAACHGAVSASYAVSDIGPRGFAGIDRAVARRRLESVRDRVRMIPIPDPAQSRTNH